MFVRMRDTRSMVPKSLVQRWYLSLVKGMTFKVSNSYCLPLHGSVADHSYSLVIKYKHAIRQCEDDTQQIVYHIYAIK